MSPRLVVPSSRAAKDGDRARFAITFGKVEQARSRVTFHPHKGVRSLNHGGMRRTWAFRLCPSWMTSCPNCQVCRSAIAPWRQDPEGAISATSDHFQRPFWPRRTSADLVGCDLEKKSHKTHSAMAGPLSEVQLASLPRCFRILVVCGPTGSGKSRIIGQLLQHFKLQEKQDDIIFKDNEAVCGHADLGDDFLEKLQAVGLNSVPSWLKPARCLSMGQRQRIESAIRASRNGEDGIVFDDFCAYVDDQSSFSCAASIWRLVKNNNGMNYVIVGTSRSQLIPYLGADIVIEAATGQILLNPLPFHERKLTVKMLPDEKLRFQFGKDQTQWHGVADEQPMQQTENYKRQATKVPFASSEKRYTSTVTMTSRTAEASEAFDLEFNGTVNQVVQVLQPRHLPDSWSIGAFCGPSGSGKSVNMRNLGCEVVIQWRHGTPIHEQADSALLDIVLLPLAAQQRCYDDLSTGQKMQADLARQLAAGGRILVDEFTSVLDRTLAAALCISVESYVRRMNLQLIVATVHLDILQQLQPDWYFRSDSAQLMTFSKGTCDRPAVPAPCMDYFRPPVRSFTVSQLGGAKRTKEVFQAHFAQHHYLKQGLPAMWGLIVRDESGTAVAFHAVAWFTGCKAPREARVVVLPEYQGMGLGTPSASRRLSQPSQ
eukprot:symbB.v1.2.014654.t1/scaffold1077.1/size139779/1